MHTIPPWALAHPWAVEAALAALAVLAVAAIVRRRRSHTSRTPAAVVCAAVAAAACTAYSGDTSWRFAGDYLDMVTAGERAAMFAAAEGALFAVALMARQNLRTTGVPGAPGVLVWVITSVQIIPAYAESGFWGGTVRAFVGPVLAALLWHLAMGIELRHSEPGADSQSLPAVLARELRERLLSRLGLAVRDRSAEQITRDRATLRAVALAARLAEMAPDKRDSRRGRRTARRLSAAVGRAQTGAHPEQRAMLLDLLAARRHATALATVDLPSPWRDDRAVTSQVTGPAALPRVIPVPVEVPIVPVLEPVPLPARVTTDMTTPVTTMAASQPVRQVVTGVVTTVPEPARELTEGGLRRAARQLNRQALKDTGRPVTIATLSAHFGLSRREATDLRREVVGRDAQ